MPWPADPPARPGPRGPWPGAAALAGLLALAGCAGLPGATPAPAPAPVTTAPVPPAPAPALPAPEPSPASPAPRAPEPAPPAEAATQRLAAWQDRLRELGAAEIAREAQRLELAIRQADSAEAAPATLELALLLGQTRHNGDLARALALADNLARHDGAPAWQALARLLHARLAEQRRQEELLERQAQQLRDQQRRLDQLASQLEALKAIERSLNARPPAQGPGGRSPP